MTSTTSQAAPTPAAPSEGTRRGRTREKLLDSAYEVFAATGVHAASVEQITEHAGFTRGAFYSNFSSKEELFFALMERENDARIAVLAERLEDTVPALKVFDEQKLADLILEFLEGPFDNRQWCIVVSEFQLLAMRDRAIAAEYLDFENRFEASLREIITSALTKIGRGFSLDPSQAMRLLISVYEDAMRSAVLAGDDLDTSVDAARLNLARVVMAITRPL
ncbi:TetR/AcrR family transcriptional regulator [Microbacteriaceae bacterium VKM Ac-2854]|nr:TetR/AcrR family transcriptional regulator [Microbacteriaceae bacterium VKM Ac-2854]